MRLVLTAIVITLTTGVAPAASERPVLTIGQVVARHDKLTGQRIRVRGWLTLCKPLSCWITPSPDRDSRPYLSIGDSKSFDRSAASLVGKEIVIDAMLDSKCLHTQVDADLPASKIVICGDRAPVLANPKLVKALQD